MRSTVINSGSKLTDVLGLLTGTWSETDSNGWHIVATPLYCSCSGTFDAGTHVLPLRFGATVAALVAYSDGTVSAQVIKIGANSIKLDKAGLVSITAYGQASKTSSLG